MIKIEEHKQPQAGLATEGFLNPKRLYLPLSQHTGRPSLPCVNIADIVEEADLLAKEDGFISVRLHSPKRGKILNITEGCHPSLKRAKCIILECQAQEKEYSYRKNVESLDKEELREIIKNSGIVGLGGAAFPTHVKLNPPKKINTLIINGCECEPYLACDYRLMIENLREIFKGIEIICKIIEPDEVIFALEDNKTEVVKKLNLLISTKRVNLPKTKSAILKTAYPQGAEKQLIYSVTRRKVPSGRLPFDVGCLVCNVATAFAVYEAVYLNKPLIERLVSFAGDAIATPKNIRVKIGTTLKELFDAGHLKFKHEPRKIICGGPMMGVALDGLDYPILKGTGGFLFLSKNLDIAEEDPCIKCARCVDSCPMNLLPLELARRIKKEEFAALDDFSIADCIECGCCNYVCPAKIPLVHYIKVGKKYTSRKD